MERGRPPLFAGYETLAGVPDEVFGPDGAVRPVWRAFLAHLGGLDAAALQHRFARGAQYLRDQGVFLRQYGAAGSTERAWPLSPLPVLIAEGEWQALAEGLRQRADLLEGVLADLYGPGRLVAEGHLPASLVAGNPEWLRPMVGVRPRSGHHLHFVAFEIGRGPDGRWWVLGDRTQAPSGAGFALENRVAVTRAFADFYAGAHVHRLAGFFREFRDALIGLRAEEDSRVAILTPGPLTDTYWEHAYIARYLGFMLLQGEDLTVQGGQVMVRTVAGPRPVSVLWRRMDSGYADPLELEPSSRLGTPGLVSALRAGTATVVNALGSGVVEARAMLAFLPRLAPVVLGEALRIPNVATWWCGGAAEREAVVANAGRLVVSPALSTRQPFEEAEPLTRRGAELRTWLEREGAGMVAQEAVGLSTTPTAVEGEIVARPMVLRVFLLRTPGGWVAMPGGFARIGLEPVPAAVAMQRGGRAADVWVVSDRPVAAATMLPPAGEPYRRPLPGMLPARAADNLFWLGRYVERTEGILRLLRARHGRLAESGEGPLLEAMGPLFAMQGVDPARGIPEGLIATLGAAIGAAGQIRDRLSVDGWAALADMDKTARRMAERVEPGEDAARAVGALLRKLSGFSGLVHENMYRFLGWRFLELGRHIERAMNMAAVLAVLGESDAPEGALDLAVEVGDSVMTHRRRFVVATTRETVIDLLALDPLNPRAIRFQLQGASEQVAALPDSAKAGGTEALRRAVAMTVQRLATERAETLGAEALWALRAEIGGVSDRLSEAYLQ